MPNMSLINSIHRIGQDIHESRQKIRTVKAEYKEAILELDEYTELQDLLKLVADKRKLLKAAIKDDANCSHIASELEELNFKLKDQRDILSFHLVAYKEETSDGFVKFDEDDGKVRPIRLKATLDKPEYHQEMLPLDGKSLAAGEAKE